MSPAKNVFADQIHRPIKIQIVSRNIPVENTTGSATYILDFMKYLRKAGCDIEYVLINSSPNGGFPWYIIPSTMAALANVSAKDNLRIGRVLLRFNLLSDWVTEPIRLIYHQIPQRLRSIYLSHLTQIIRNIYRFITKKTRERRTSPTTMSNVHIPNLRDFLATPEEMAFAREQISRFKPDIVIVNYAYSANILDTILPDEAILKVILTHDVFHRRNIHFKQIGVAMYEGDWDWEKETAQLQKAQVLLAIQEEDVKVFKEMASHSEVICMPMSAICHSNAVKQIPGRCLFVGSEGQHNYYGLQWFLENVWPIVIQLIPDSSLHVCGAVCDLIQGTFPNVRLLGRVEDLKPEYGAAEVCLVPLLAGSGLKIKLVEAMSYGRACVSTSVGVQGLREIAGKTTLVADTSEDFAAAIHTLLTNPDKRQLMEEQAHRYVTEKLSPQAAYQPFVDYIHQYLEQVLSKPKIVGFEKTVDLDKIISSS